MEYNQFIGSNAFSAQLVKKTQVFKHKVRDWIRRDVGNLEENIKQLERDIDIVQGVLMTDPHNISLQKKNVDLSQNLNQVLKLEEIKWAQKSRQAWTQLVDKNNRYFRTIALNRRKKNKI